MVINLPKGLLQDWTYILLAKSRELLGLKDYAGSLDMLKIVDAEVHSRSSQLGNAQAGYKLFKLLEWEILLVEVTHFLHQWPKVDSAGAKTHF